MEKEKINLEIEQFCLNNGFKKINQEETDYEFMRIEIQSNYIHNLHIEVSNSEITVFCDDILFGVKHADICSIVSEKFSIDTLKDIIKIFKK